MARIVIYSALLFACGPPVPGGPQGDGGETTSSSTSSNLPATATVPMPTSASSTSLDTTTTDATDATFGVSSSSSDDTASGFIVLPDGGSVCAPAPDGTLFHCECDVWSQDCADGWKCTPWANDGAEVWNATRCSEIDPDAGAPGEACTIVDSPTSGIDSCVAGSMCWEVDPDTLEGECIAFCGGSENNATCEAGTECMVANDGVLVLCMPPCDPLAATPCTAAHSCHPIRDTWFCLPDGAAIESDGLMPALCPAGSTAIDPASQSFCDPDLELCCAQICDVTDSSCTPPLTCVAVAETGNAGLCSDA